MPAPAPPQHCPTPRELDDLELLVNGALSPTTRFGEPGSPVTLTLPPLVETAAREAGAVELVDPEGLPLARVTVPGGVVQPLTAAQYGPFRHLYLNPKSARRRYRGRAFVPVTGPLATSQLDALRAEGPVVLLALCGIGTPRGLSPIGLVRATLRAADLLDDAVVAAVPLASHDDAAADEELRDRVVGSYAGDDRVLALVRSNDVLPDEIADVVDFDQPPPGRRGLVLFFTGLSGSGKSTLARALMDRLLEQGTRTVTSLDGDVVRRNLSAGLTFSREDRETNIRRIGWVAAEISRHGGVAVCSPIAPFDETRQQVRQMVDDAGGAFFLVHVATPLEECERRDRKGLYAKARRGEIPEFTGISSPYEEPEDADVRVDTTGRTIDDALEDVLHALKRSRHLDLLPPGTPVRPAPPTVRPAVFPVVDSAPVVDNAPVVEQRGAPATSVVETPGPENRPTPQDGPLNVLFVCTANICRSPFMELLARRLAGPDAEVRFASAGTHGFAAHAMDDVMASTLDGRGVSDRTAFRSRPLDPDLLEQADVVLTAEAGHRAFILEDHPALFRKVFTLGQFVEALGATDGELSGRALLKRLAERRVPSTGLDVKDPYRRGPEAAERAAAEIEAMLRVVVPALTGSRKTTP